jgi:hypothetical protein
MSVGELFSLKDQAKRGEEHERLHMAADAALAEAEYEYYAMRADLQAALDVPLRHRAIIVEPPVDASDEAPPSAAAA